MLIISNRPRLSNRARPILKLLARLLPELCSTRSNYRFLSGSHEKTKIPGCVIISSFMCVIFGTFLEKSAFEFLYGGQFTLSTQLIKTNYLVLVNSQLRLLHF